MFTGRKLALTLAFTVLVALAFGVSCKGFFVSPTLTTVSVSPSSQTIETGSTDNTQQFIASGIDSDNDPVTNPAVIWTSSEPAFATISASGLATAVSIGQTTITATSVQNGTISGTASLTVTVGCIQSIAVSPTSASIGVTEGANNYQFDAKATTCNGVVDITSTATWNSSNTSVATVSDGDALAVAQGTTTITASSGSITSNGAVLTVGP
jgi:hypothetical protein